MGSLNLTFACGPYDRTQALRDGTIRPDGIDLNYLSLQPAEIFWRMLQFKEFEASELSLSNYVMMLSTGNCPFVAVPAFPSRAFRHGYFFINTEKGIRSPQDLRGKRGGVPEYSMTAAVYMRGLMEHEFGIKPSEIEWVQGRPDRIGHNLPAGIRRTMAPHGVELGDLLERGEIDFLICSNNPLSFRRKAATIQRLFPNYTDLEKDYYRRTKIYPIMHTIVIRRDIYDRYPWAATSLYKALCQSKERAFRFIEEMGTPKSSFAWLQGLLDEERSIIGSDWFPYGIDRNRASIEALLQYTYEQGLSDRRIAIDELFVPSCMVDIPLSEGQLI